MKPEKPEYVLQQDWDDADIPELTATDLANPRPFAEVFPAIHAAEMRKNKGGRPKSETPKVHMGFRLAAEIAIGIKATGRGYNATVEAVLREALAAGRFDRS